MKETVNRVSEASDQAGRWFGLWYKMLNPRKDVCVCGGVNIFFTPNCEGIS